MSDYDIKPANEFRNIGEVFAQLKELLYYILAEEGFKTKEQWWDYYLWPAILELIQEKRLRIELVPKKVKE